MCPIILLASKRKIDMPRNAQTTKADVTLQVKTAQIPTTSKNPARGASRRAELIEVATKMFLERGFHNTSIRDIVRACTFNVASLYMYVSSKEDILYLVAQDLMSTISRELSETSLDPKSSQRSLEIGFASYCCIANKFRRQIRLLYREVGFLPEEPRSYVLGTVSDVVTFFETIIDQGIKSGDFRKVPARLVAMNAMMMAHTIALHTRELRKIADLDEYIHLQTDSIFAGILTDTTKRRPRKSPARKRKTSKPASKSSKKTQSKKA